MSGKILEELGMTKEEFTKGYTFVKDETSVADGKGCLLYTSTMS